jgi:hypothetical protein
VSAYVFVGPTLAREEVEAACEVTCLPPVAQGDVFRACQNRPRVIGVIDGYFEGVPSVWHKEILWALSQGVHVFGSASMGALRAAELHVFGMRGVGRVFEQYRDGVLEDDDEVAVVHGPAEVGYAPLSEPMVNIRATLERALGEGVIGAPVARELARIAKDTFYQHRSWDALFEQAAKAGLDDAVLATLRAWLAKGKVDQKRGDALAMLSSMQQLLATDPEPNRAVFDFEWTEMWDEVVSDDRGLGEDTSESSVSDEHVLDELRLADGAFAQATLHAALRHLALRDARQDSIEIGRQALRKRIDRLRTEQRLFSRKALDTFLEQSAIDAGSFERLLEDEARVEVLVGKCAHRLDTQRLAHLRASGAYPRLIQRARDKQQTLRASGREDTQPLDLGLIPTQLVAWYFKRLGRPIPDDIDACVRDLGLDRREAFYRLIAREYVYSSVKQQSADKSQENKQ